MAINCANCGAAIAAENNFCPSCGARLTAAKGFTASERRQITVVFCDLVGSTRLSSLLDPEDMSDLLGSYHRTAGAVVARHGGHVAQYLGDGMLVYFGYPQAREDDAERAVRCGLEIIERLATVSIDGTAAAKLEARVGIHTGPVVTGDLGPGGSGEALAIGVTPNVAARVQSEARIGAVLISSSTQTLVASQFELEVMGAKPLRGLQAPMELYQVLAPRQVETGAAALPFVGRVRELDAIIATVRATKGILVHPESRSKADGSPALVFVSGEAGIGKTRLLTEVQNRLRRQVKTWTTLRASAHHQNTPLYPLRVWLIGQIGLHRHQSSSLQQQVFDRFAASRGIELENERKQLAAFADLSVAADKVDNSYQSSEVAELLIRLLLSSGPGVLVFENLHWADATTQELLSLLVPRLGGQALICTARPEIDPTWATDFPCCRVHLSGLSAEDIQGLTQSVPELPAELIGAITERSDGNPLFVVELAGMLADAQKSGKESHGIDDIPLSLRDLLMARLDGLGQAREVLQVGAVLGRAFELDLVCRIAPHIPQSAVQTALASDLLHQSSADSQCRFRHSLIQETAYRSLLRSKRRQLHGAVANELMGSAMATIEPETLARHFKGSQQYEPAVESYGIAGKNASKRGAYVEAIAHLESALDLLEQLPEGSKRDFRELKLRQYLAVPTFAVHGYTNSDLVATYRRSGELAETVGTVDEAFVERLKLWGFYVVHADLQRCSQAVADVASAAKLATRADAQAIADYVHGATSFYMGDHKQALANLPKALSYFLHRSERQSTASPLYNGWVVQSWSLAIAGRIQEAWGTINAALEFARVSEDPFALAQSLDHKAVIARELGMASEVVARIATEVLAVEHDHKFRSHYSSVMFLSWHKALLGDPDAAEKIRQQIERMREIGTRQPLGNMLNVLIEALRANGQDHLAARAIDEALTVARTQATRHHLPETLLAKAELAEQHGDTKSAGHHWSHAASVAKQQGAGLLNLKIHCSAHEAGACSGEDLQAALRLVDFVPDNRFVARAVQLLNNP